MEYRKIMAIKFQNHLAKCQKLEFPIKLNCVYFKEKYFGKLGLRSSSHFGLPLPIMLEIHYQSSHWRCIII